jgi:hypothetical protein
MTTTGAGKVLLCPPNASLPESAQFLLVRRVQPRERPELVLGGRTPAEYQIRHRRDVIRAKIVRKRPGRYDAASSAPT